MKTYVIAEIGINHNGELQNALDLIDVAAKADCQAAKFQFFTAKNLYPKSAGKLDWRNDKKTYAYDIYEAVKGFELPREWIDVLIQHCDSVGIEFLSSVFDVGGLRHLIDRGMRKIKLSSYTITNLPLVEEAAKAYLPIFMSTGGASLGEVEEAVELVKQYHSDLSLLHCSLHYPTELTDCNLGVMKTFKFAFPASAIGYSDHTREISDAAVQSIYLGGSVIEKHITLDKSMEGPDHFFALNPSELLQLVSDIKRAEELYEKEIFSIDTNILGSSEKKTYRHEKYLRKFAYMGLFSRKIFKNGEIINPEDIAILRSGKKEGGLPPKYLELFRSHNITAKREIAFEEPLQWDAIL